MTTVDEAAEALGLHTYDTALPQDWVDDFAIDADVQALAQRLGVSNYPSGQFVWGYDVARTFGEPVALTPEAKQLLAAYQKRG